MELQDAIRARRMVRRTSSEPIAEGVVEELLDLARRAPTAGNAQGQSWVVVRDEARRHAIAEAAGEPAFVARGFAPWLSSAPVLVVPCADERAYRSRYAEPDKLGADGSVDGRGVDGWSVPYWWLDAGAALQQLLLLVTEAGLVAGFLGEHAVPGLGTLLALPHGVHAIGVVPIGHPHPDGERPTSSARRPRRALADVVHPERWPTA